MSRIGKQPIVIPKGVEITLKDEAVYAKGPKGELSVEIPRMLSAKVEEESVIVEVTRKTSDASARWGLCRALVANIVQGVSEGFTKRLEVHGVGYRSEMQGEDLVLHLGYSHPVVMKVPEGIQVALERPNNIVISGIDKQVVGQFAANIRRKRPPEPYKGKGIRYAGEVVKRKVGKRAVAGA